MTEFTGYSPDALDLLTGIGGHDKAWFDGRRSEYDELIVQPTKDLVIDLGDTVLNSISPDIQAVPRVNGSISPINNDVRFVNNPTYKDYVLLRFWEGDDKKSAVTLFTRINEQEVGFGCGLSLAGPSLERYRAAVAGSAGEALTEALQPLVRRHGAVLAGADLKRVPRPYDEDHPRADLLRHKWFQVRWTEPAPAAIHGPRFVPWCSRRLSDLAGVHMWLRDNV